MREMQRLKREFRKRFISIGPFCEISVPKSHPEINIISKASGPRAAGRPIQIFHTVAGLSVPSNARGPQLGLHNTNIMQRTTHVASLHTASSYSYGIESNMTGILCSSRQEGPEPSPMAAVTMEPPAIRSSARVNSRLFPQPHLESKSRKVWSC